jgi:hypothetical protein
MRHPDLSTGCNTLEKRINVINVNQSCTAILTRVRRKNLSSEVMGKVLRSVTYTQKWNAAFDGCQVRKGSLGIAN